MYSWKKMSLKQGIGDASYMNKRIPTNAKYQHIKTRLDTGCSLTKYTERVENIKINYKYSKDEIFKRLRVTEFAQLVLRVASDSELRAYVPPLGSEAQSNGSNPCPSTKPQEVGDSQKARPTLLGVISGVGERTMNHGHDPKPGPDSHSPYPDCPYLLLDVRDRDHYDSCHIISAHSFPIACLSRTINPYTKEMLEYKNAPGKIIIVYDEDERLAKRAATMMCQRGFKNVSMLSGGLRVLGQKFPGSLVSGPLPPLCRSRSRCVKDRRAAPPSGHTPAKQRWRFTTDELIRLTVQLDELFVASDSSSRTSSCGSSVSLQSATSRRSSSCNRPWK